MKEANGHGIEIMNQETPILQVVGYQNSGKTTLITKLIKMLKEMSYRVGTLKHHGHDGVLYTKKDVLKERTLELTKCSSL
jgi:molybdopterin-guanine dinucleotide biosynthesis protein B